jgi:integrating conjugative element protein (TIGR03756 family)
MTLRRLLSRYLRLGMATLLLAGITPTFALTTAVIVSSALSPECLSYRVVGVCYWLLCTNFGCSVRTSTKVRHYVPDAVVSSYSNTGLNPWIDVSFMSTPNPTARAGGDGTTNQDHENNLAKFKNADVIGHPAGAVFNQFAGQSGTVCAGAGTAFVPYLLSTLDTIAWRYNIPESVFPESLIPGCGRSAVVSRRTSGAMFILAAGSCIRPMTTRAAPSWPSARVTSSPGPGRSTCISHCSPTRNPATGRRGR